MAHGEVECTVHGCGTKIEIQIGSLTALARSSSEPGEVWT